MYAVGGGSMTVTSDTVRDSLNDFLDHFKQLDDFEKENVFSHMTVGQVENILPFKKCLDSFLQIIVNQPWNKRR